MASQGPLSPSTIVNSNASGSVAWNNPSNAGSSNNVYATVSPFPVTSNYLKATNFGFSIPAGATIDGIKVEIEKKSSSVISRDVFLKLVKSDGSIGTTNKANTTDNYPTNDTVYTYGSNTDLWGETWTDADINNSNFGVVFSVSSQGTVSVDNIQITVYYSVSGNATFSSPVLSAVLSIAAAAIVTSQILSPAVQTASFSTPTANVSAGSAFGGSPIGLLLGLTRADVNVTVTPPEQVLSFSLPGAVVPQGVTVSAAVQTATFSTQESVVEAIVDFAPSAQSATFSTQTPTVTAIQNVTVSPLADTLTFSTPTPSVFTGQILSVPLQSASLSTQSVTVQYGVTISGSVVSSTFSVQSPIVGLGTLVTPDTQELTFSIEESAASAGVNISPSAQSLQFTSFSPAFVLDYIFTLNPVTASFSVQAPTKIGGFYTNKYQHRNNSYGDKYTSRNNEFDDKYTTRGNTFDDKYTKLNL